MLELAVELGNSYLVQLLLDEGATVNPEGSVVPPLMIAVLHRHRENVQLLLDARADPRQAIPIVSLCDHPWYWFGFLSRRESVNVVQISAAQDPEDTVADLLPQSQDTQSPKATEGVVTIKSRWYCHDGACRPSPGQYNSEVSAQYRTATHGRVLILRTHGDVSWQAYIYRFA